MGKVGGSGQRERVLASCKVWGSAYRLLPCESEQSVTVRDTEPQRRPQRAHLLLVKSWPCVDFFSFSFNRGTSHPVILHPGLFRFRMG